MMVPAIRKSSGGSKYEGPAAARIEGAWNPSATRIFRPPDLSSSSKWGLRPKKVAEVILTGPPSGDFSPRNSKGPTGFARVRPVDTAGGASAWALVGQGWIALRRAPRSSSVGGDGPRRRAIVPSPGHELVQSPGDGRLGRTPTVASSPIASRSTTEDEW